MNFIMCECVVCTNKIRDKILGLGTRNYGVFKKLSCNKVKESECED